MRRSVNNFRILHILQIVTGKVKVDMQKKQYDFEIKGAKVFASANDIKRISKPLQSRFRKLFLPRYTEEQFIQVSIKVLKNHRRNGPIYRHHGISQWWGVYRKISS